MKFNLFLTRLPKLRWSDFLKIYPPQHCLQLYCPSTSWVMTSNIKYEIRKLSCLFFTGKVIPETQKLFHAGRIPYSALPLDKLSLSTVISLHFCTHALIIAAIVQQYFPPLIIITAYKYLMGLNRANPILSFRQPNS